MSMTEESQLTITSEKLDPGKDAQRVVNVDYCGPGMIQIDFNS